MTLQEAKERINELKPKIEYYTIKYLIILVFHIFH